MALRGRKPKPNHLRVVHGGPGKAPEAHEAQNFVLDPGYDNNLTPPKKLKKREQELWITYIRRAQWLTAFDVPRAFMWVSLHARFEATPDKMNAGMIAQLRALGSELGMDPSSRSRIAADKSKNANRDPADKYFTD
jgi:hypothetical protein